MAEITDTAQAADEPPPGRGMLRETGDSIAAVFRNPNLRRIQLAFAGSAVGDWAYATAVAVWAYGVGGARAVGIFVAIRLLLAALLAPLGATLADRLDRRRLMMGCDLARALLVSGAATVLLLDGPAWPVFVLATCTSLLTTPFMVAQRSMLPSLAERPEELTAANGTASTIDSLSFFVGPALGAALLGIADVEVVFLVNVLTFLWSLALVARVRPRQPAPAAVSPGPEGGEPPPGEDDETDETEKTSGFLTETMAGFRAIREDRGLILVTASASVQTVIAGASSVFAVVMAVEILGIGAHGVGYLEAVLGVGAVLGGLLAISRVAKGRLAGDMVVGVLLWSAPLLLVVAWPHPVTCFAAMALLGLGNPLVDVNMDTITQRITPDAVLGRVFGAFESCFIATMALGAFAMPFLIEWLSLRWGLLAVTVPVVVLALLLIPAARRLDGRLAEPEFVPLLRGIDIFSPLPPAVLDALARDLVPRSVVSGEEVVREGDVSDRFYVIVAGEVEVTQDGRVLRREGPGDYFGEIGLLRDVPRTATVTATRDTELLSLDREPFLRLVSGHREAQVAAESTVRFRLRS